MSRIAVDASAVLPVFLEEPFSDAARLIFEPKHDKLAPELIFSEVHHGLLKRVRGGLIVRAQAERAIAELAVLVDTEPAAHLTLRALDIALAFDRSAYDALYVAFAIEQGCPLVTADRKLYNATNRAFPETMVWIEDAGALD